MNRLEALYAQYVKVSTYVDEIADIGADHGYLSKKILDSGFRGRLIVTDVAKMPLDIAKKNIGPESQVEYRLCDGLQGDFSQTGLIFIAGMGGDLISGMLRKAEELREDIVFVLQPMTNFEKALTAIADRYRYSYFANEKNKHYRILVASHRKEIVDQEDMISIPLLSDFDEIADSALVMTSPQSEIVLKENLKDALLFFRYKYEQAKKISYSVKEIQHLYERSVERERRIEAILDLLEERI